MCCIFLLTFPCKTVGDQWGCELLAIQNECCMAILKADFSFFGEGCSHALALMDVQLKIRTAQLRRRSWSSVQSHALSWFGCTDLCLYLDWFFRWIFHVVMVQEFIRLQKIMTFQYTDIHEFFASHTCAESHVSKRSVCTVTASHVSRCYSLHCKCLWCEDWNIKSLRISTRFQDCEQLTTLSLPLCLPHCKSCW